MSTRPWMPLYVGDYLSDTRRLTTLQHGIYMLLIMDYWSTGGLPDDDAQLAQIAGVTTKQWECNRNAIASLFQAGWKHKRIEEELAKAADVSSKRKANADKRWSKSNANASANGDAKGMHRAPVSHSQSQDTSSLRSDGGADASAKPDPRPTTPRAKIKTQIPEDAQPDERQRADAAEAGLNGDPFRAEWRKFRDYHRSKGSLMADWQAAWRTWLGNIGGFQPRAGPPGSPPRPTGPQSRNGFHAYLNGTENEQPADDHDEIADRAASARDVTPRRDDPFEAEAEPKSAFALHR